MFPSRAHHSTDHETLTRALPGEKAEKLYFPFAFIMGHHNVWSPRSRGVLEKLSASLPSPPHLSAGAGVQRLPIYFAFPQSHALRRERNYRQLAARRERAYERLGDN